MTLVWERAPYTAGSLLVLLALADWANDDGVAWPSMEKLAKKARIDRRSAQRIVRQLEKDGTLEIEEGGGRSKQHRYRIKTETVTKCRPLMDEINGDISDVETATFQTQRATLDPKRATFETERATPTSPDPLVEPSEEPLEEPLLDPSEVGIPFSSPEFLSALGDFEQHRKEKRVKVTATARRLMFKRFLCWGEHRSIAALIHSTENNYTGCFEERNGNGINKTNNEFRRPTAADRNGEQLARNLELARGLRRSGS